MIDTLIYAYLPCPLCGRSAAWPLMAWIAPGDYSEDGHSNGFEICELVCPKCGKVEPETNEEERKVMAVVEEIEQALWEGKTLEIGTIHSYYPGLIGKQDDKAIGKELP